MEQEGPSRSSPPPGWGSSALDPAWGGRLPRDVDRVVRGGRGRVGGGEEGSGGMTVASCRKVWIVWVSAQGSPGWRKTSPSYLTGKGNVTTSGEGCGSITMA